MVHTGALKTELLLIQFRFEMREWQHLTGLGSPNDRHTELPQLGKNTKRYYTKTNQHEGLKWSLMCLKGQTVLQHKHIMSASTTNRHLPGTSMRIKSCAATAADLQHPLKEFRVEGRNEAFCAPRKLAGQVFTQIFSAADFLSSILLSPHTQKNTKIPPGDDCFL